MKIRVFQSDKGDCLLLTSNDGKHVMVDGGMANSYTEHVAPFLNRLHEHGENLDLVYVSHIDQDHISGVLKMADDLVRWKIFEFQRSQGNTHIEAPDELRPPEILKVWNNAFHDQVGENAGAIEQLLAARTRVLSFVPKDFAREALEEHVELAQSEAEAVRLSRRLGSGQLNVPLNPEFNHGLMFVTDPAEAMNVGTLQFTVIGPFTEELDKLKDAWNKWLESAAGQRHVDRIRRNNDQDEDNLRSDWRDDVLAPLLAQAAVLGKRSDVTLPNLASLMFHLEETGGATMLLTGDGHWQDILAGLESAGKLVPGSGLHVDVLKVQHHGSEHNWHHDFGKRITADHYIFCGNGAHHNPDLDVLDAVLESRLGPATKRSNNAEVGNPFKLWFNCASSIAKPENRSHMKKIETKIKAAETAHSGIVSSQFLTDSSFELDL